MAIKQDLGTIQNLAHRMVRILDYRQKAQVLLDDDNPDIPITITDEMREEMRVRFEALKDQLKALAAGL